MSPRLAVATAMVCALVGGAGGGIATAQSQRPVAVIVLSDDEPARQLAKDVGNALYGHPTLRPLADQELISELLVRSDEENTNKLRTAEDSRGRAERALAQFAFGTAASEARAGQESLHGAIPNTQVVSLYADLTLAYGTARLGENDLREAGEAFALVHRLVPGRRLDPARYLPEIVQAFEQARPLGPPAGTVVVRGGGRLWIDGKDLGPVGPAPYPLATGSHVVWLSGPDRETAGVKVVVKAGEEVIAELPDAPASIPVKVHRARLALKYAPDPTARGAAMRRLAALLDVRDAVVISSSGGKLIGQTWHDKAEPGLLPGFSAHRLAEPQKAGELLRPLTAVVRAPPPGLAPLPGPAPAWYQRRVVQAGIVAGVVGIVVGSILIARSRDDTVGLGDPSWLVREVGR